MAAAEYRGLADRIASAVGGTGNIASATHCATRLRLRLVDDSRADQSAVEAIPGVIAVMRAGGQFQVVVGDDVPQVHREVVALLGPEGTADSAPAPRAAQNRGNVFNRFLDLVSSIFTPILWTLAGAGLLKSFVIASGQFGWLDAESQTYTILNAAADATFYFLPLFLAITSAKRFGANQFVSLAIAGALLYPSIVALAEADVPVTFAGIPVAMTTYVSSVIPIIVAVWVQSHLERGLARVLPRVVRNFANPLVTIAVMVPLVLLVVGPITILVGNGVTGAVRFVFDNQPWIAGAVQGGLGQVFVLFGLHWAFTPIYFTEFANNGFTLLYAPLMASVLAQGAATLAVLVRTRSAARRTLAGPAAFSAIFAGITEPAVYGVNLPLRKPFYAGIAGGVVGGALIAGGGTGVTAAILPSLLALPAFLQVGNVTTLFVGMAAAMIIGFVGTFVLVDREAGTTADLGGAAPVPPVTPGNGTDTALLVRTLDVVAPVTGRVVPLDDVPDRVFASRALGEGIGILPSEGRVYAPVSGTLVTTMDSGHAYGIKSDDGVEVLVHIGINTVHLDGRGFSPAVAKGQRVVVGDLLAEFDTETITAEGYDTTTVVVVTNSAQLTGVTTSDAETVGHGDRVLSVEI